MKKSRCIRGMAAVVLILVLLAVPVMAENRSTDSGEARLTQEGSAMTFVSPDRTTGTGAAPVGRGGSCSPDTQSPLLPGTVSFREYDTIFIHGMNAVPDAPDPDIDTIDLYGEGLDLILVGKNSSLYPDAVIYCPLPSYEKKTGGMQPMARYIAVQYASGLDASFSPEVYKVEVFNGCSPVKTLSTTFSNDGSCSVQILDLGGWYAFHRGMNIAISLRNVVPSTEGFFITGYGARFEW